MALITRLFLLMTFYIPYNLFAQNSTIVNVYPLPTITLGINPSICAGETSASLPFSAITASPNLYSIDFNLAAEGQGFVDVSDSTLLSTPIVITVPGGVLPGTYLAVLTVKNANSCSSVNYNISVTINAAPTAPTASVTLQPTCSVATGTITVSSSTVGLSFSIDGLDYSNTTGIFTELPVGDYTLTAMNAATCISPISGIVSINPAPGAPTAPVASATLQPTCSVSTGTIAVSSSLTGLSFSIDDVDYSNTNGIFTGLAAGTYSVTAKNASNCLSSGSNVTINAQPSGPSAAILSGTTNICSTSSTNLTLTITGGVSPYTVVFNDGIGNTTINNYTSGSNYSVSPTSTKTYSLISVTGANGCLSGGLSGTPTVTVNNCNNTPVAVNDNATVNEDGTLNTNVSANDSGLGDTPVTFSVLTNVSNGTLTFNNDGTYTYSPNANFNGSDSFTYTVCDIDMDCATATVTITVNAVNDPIFAGNDAASVNEDGTLNGTTVLVNDGDLDGSILTVNTTPTINVTNGTLVLNADGTFTYTPNANFNGTDSFTYQVCNFETPQECATAIVTITVNPVNDPIFAGNDAASVNEDGTLNGTTVLVNDGDPDGSILTVNITPTVNVTHGTLVLNANGTYTYTPNANFNGTDSFTYQVCNNETPQECATAIVTITVNAVNDKPLAMDNTGSVLMNNVLNGSNLLSNDSDPETDLLTINTTPVTNVINGTLVINADGTYTYTPNSGFSGTDSFEYAVCDNGTPSLCDTALVSININAVDNIPVAVNDNATVNEDGTLNTNVSANDSGLGDTPVTFSVLTGVSNGTLTFNNDGTYSYSPNANFNGSDSFTYTVCDIDMDCATATVTITVNALNDPIFAANDAASVNEDGTLNGTTILVNDGDLDGSTLTVNTTPTVNVTNGTLVLNANGTYTYTPNPNFNGTDSFTYQICNNETPQECTTATVTITVNALNDPIFAGNDAASVNEDGTLNGTTILVNDGDLDGSTLTVNTTPTLNVTNGTLVLNANGTYTYTPNPNYNGTDSFTYQVCNNETPQECATATVTITVNAVNDKPLAIDNTGSVLMNNVLNGSNLLINDSDPEADLLTINTTPVTNVINGTLVINADGTYTYTPNSGFSGTDSFEYAVCDNGTPSLCDTALVSININAVDNIPVAVNDNATVNEDGTLNTNVSANDSGLGDTPVTFSIVTGVSNGTLTFNNDGTYTYSPNANFNGSDSFTYTVCDIDMDCATATVIITVNAVNDPIFAGNDAASVNEDGTLNGTTVLVSDGDLDGSILTVNTTPTVNVTNGTLVLNANGTYTYTPNANFNGTDSFTYLVCNNETPQECATAIVTITVNSVNDKPIVHDTTITTIENNPFTVCLPISDADTGQNYSVSSCGNPVNGISSSTITGNQVCVTYTPNLNFNGLDSLCIIVCDNGSPGLCDTAYIHLIVTPVNDKPIVHDTTITTIENNPFTVCLPILDSDAGQIYSVSSCGNPVNGISTTTITGNQVCVTYTPNLNFNGLDSLCIIVCDNGSPGLCDTAYIHLIVTPVNDKPIVHDTTITTIENNPFTVCLPISDADTGQNYSVSTCGNPVNGIASTTVSGNQVCVTYTPNLNFNGLDSLCIIVCDNGSPSLCDTAYIHIVVIPATTGPIVSNETYTGITGNPINGNILSNDLPNGVTVGTVIDNTNNGTTVINSNGGIVYTPNNGFSGYDTLIVNVCYNGICLPDTVFITVYPDLNNDNGISTDGGATYDGNVLSNDSGTGLNATGTPITNPTNGSIVINGNGTFVYTPNPGFCGIDSAQYQACDSSIPTLCQTAWIFVNVECPTPLTELSIPKGFSPNDDGTNDLYVIRGIENYPNNKFEIFNRWGNKVFNANPYKNTWDGKSTQGLRVGNDNLPVGTYFFVLDLGDGSEIIKGYIYLTR